MTINERILALRRAAGLSQEALAEQVGVSRQAIGKWESGASLPGLDNLQELARALGVSCDELLTGKESGTENTAGQDGVALESVKALLDAQNAAQAHAAHRQRILLAGLAAALACVGAALVYLGVYLSLIHILPARTYAGRANTLQHKRGDLCAKRSSFPLVRRKGEPRKTMSGSAVQSVWYPHRAAALAAPSKEGDPSPGLLPF